MLGIRVGAGIPGTKPWIKWAMIDGLNKSMRTNIASRPLGELRITKNIVLDFGFGEFEFAVTPSGDIENKHMSADAHQWLAAHAKAQGATGPEDGLRLLIEDLGNLTLAGKLNPSALKLLAAEAGND
jgi:hypothetical protein